MLVNERMLESYIAARKWLKPDGIMLPTTSTLFACPFSDAQLYLEVRVSSTLLFFYSQRWSFNSRAALVERRLCAYLSHMTLARWQANRPSSGSRPFMAWT